MDMSTRARMRTWAGLVAVGVLLNAGRVATGQPAAAVGPAPAVIEGT
jgi:hypothetical protein